MTGSDETKTTDVKLAPIVVLVNPQLGENIGMAARAMANFGLFDMRLVDAREGWDRERAVKAASGAYATVETAKDFTGLPTALTDTQFVYAATARPRDMTKDVMTPEQAGFDMRTRIARGEKVAILFGRERYGLSNDEVALADVIITAPVNPAYASLNIAQAVLLLGYEWFKHDASSLGQATPELAALKGPGLHMPGTEPATKDELYGFYDHLERELSDAGFFKTEAKQPIMMRNIRNIFARTTLTEQEIKSLRGIVSSLTRTHERRKAAREAKAKSE